MKKFTEIKPGKRVFKRLYLKLMLWFTGRAIQAAAKVDPVVKSEFAAMPDEYTFCLGAFPSGPYMVVGKDAIGRVQYLGSSIKKRDIDLTMLFKSTAHFFLAFTFQESTPVANARDRLFVDGDVPQACAVVRILDIVQVYLLPKAIARLAIKRYPRWSLKRHTINRVLINIRAIAGF